MRLHPFIHIVFVQQQIITIELMKEQSEKENKEQKNKSHAWKG